MTDKENSFEKDINIPRKEEIITDGVDVSGCEWFKDGMCYAECDLEGYTDWECHDEDINNCYFKQLARKTQECEELKSESFTRESLISMQEKDIDRYRKALEEIETVTKINCEEICGRKFTDCKDTSCFSVNILDIISRAKDC